MVENGCVICQDETATATRIGDDLYKVTCFACGTYCCEGDASRSLHHEPLSAGVQVANAQGWIRENQQVTLRSEDVSALRTLNPPSVAERAEKLLIALSKEGPAIGSVIEIAHEAGNTMFWCAISWSADAKELHYLLTAYLTDTKGWLKQLRSSSSGRCVQISPAGYDYLDSLRLGTSDRPTGFCAMWFNPEVTAPWTDAIQPAINAAGYEAVRIDGVEHNNKIDDEILANIRACRFIVADFTGERGGVYFEAGFALGLGRKVIWTVREDWLEKVHFDNRQYNFIVWKADDLADFKKRLQLRIEATIGRGPVQ